MDAMGAVRATDTEIATDAGIAMVATNADTADAMNSKDAASATNAITSGTILELVDPGGPLEGVRRHGGGRCRPPKPSLGRVRRLIAPTACKA